MAEQLTFDWPTGVALGAEDFFVAPPLDELRLELRQIPCLIHRHCFLLVVGGQEIDVEEGRRPHPRVHIDLLVDKLYGRRPVVALQLTDRPKGKTLLHLVDGSDACFAHGANFFAYFTAHGGCNRSSRRYGPRRVWAVDLVAVCVVDIKQNGPNKT